MEIRSRKLLIVIVLAVLISAVIVASERAIGVTETPEFCGKNCHIMKPFYDSWQTSSHNNTPCVRCHYEPGGIGKIKGKITGLRQFYNYETKSESYFGILYAKVLDKNCLSCHEDSIYIANISYTGKDFSHVNHLLRLKREIGLSCTSCHSMVVVGMREHIFLTNPTCIQCHPDITKMLEGTGHVVVTNSTCFTCHFRNVPEETLGSGCRNCHGPPDEKAFENYTDFTHSNHVGRGIECLFCHTDISRGADEIIPKDACYSCHNIKERVEKYDDFIFVHRNHVTNNKIACYNCHTRVEHSPTIKENVCTTCHAYPLKRP